MSDFDTLRSVPSLSIIYLVRAQHPQFGQVGIAAFSSLEKAQEYADGFSSDNEVEILELPLDAYAGGLDTVWLSLSSLCENFQLVRWE